MGYSIIKRVWILSMAIMIGFLFIYYIVQPYILEPLCLTNSGPCFKIKYWKYHNSVLVSGDPYGQWWWFDGTNLFVFGEITDIRCPNSNSCLHGDPKAKCYQAAYMYDLPKKQIVGYQCMWALDNILRAYKAKGIKSKYLFVRPKTGNYNNIFDTFNYLVENEIIYYTPGRENNTLNPDKPWWEKNKK